MESHGQVLTINALVFGILALGFVTLRISFRARARKLSASDLLLAVALISSIAQDAFQASCVTQWGYGHHRKDFPDPVRLSPVPLKLLWLNQVFFKLTTLCTKLSICVIYLNIFRRANSRLIRATRMVTVCTAVLVVGYYSAAFWVSIFQCTPVSKSWYPKASGSCIDLNKFRRYTAAANIITSVLIIMTPLPALRSLMQARPEISELIGLILLGLAHTACTIARLVIMQHPDPATKSDPQWTSITPLTIATIEKDVGIIVASLIVMRPCFLAVSSTVSRRSQIFNSSLSKSDPQRISLSASAAPPNKGIIRITEVEMQSEPKSVCEATPRNMF